MKHPLVIIGAGGHAKVVAEAAQLSGFDVLGFIDQSADSLGKTLLGIPLLGDENALNSLPCGDWVAVIAVGDNASRASIAARLSERGVRFAQVIHPSSVISPSAQLGDGCVVLAGAVIGPLARVGAHCILNTMASIDHDCVLDDFVHISPGAHVAGECFVGQAAHVGTGVSVVPNCSIGIRSIIGAGAAVIGDIPADVTATGVPARVSR